MRLILVVSHTPSPPERDDRSVESLPALPALSRWLARGRPTPDRRPWFDRVAGLWPLPSPAALSAASIASASAGPLLSGAWLAQPVSLQPATDHLRMPAHGLLRLSAEEGAIFCGDFGRLFGGDGLSLRPLSDGALLLDGLVATQGAGDPAAWLGSRLDAASRQGDAVIRRLTSEIELWLYEHPVNQARERRRQPVISTLWLWGGEPSTTQSRRFEPIGSVHSSDPVVTGAARLAGVATLPPLARCEDMPKDAPETVLAQVDARDGLAQLEADWFAPALAALEGGHVASMRLLMLDREVELSRSDRWRVWRRTRPWWDTLAR